MSLYERGDVPAGGEGGSAAVYGLDSTPAEGAQPAKGTLPRKATKPLAPQALKAKQSINVPQ